MSQEPIPTFDGFPAAAIQFLRDLELNNNKPWFDANKTTYVEAVQKPAVALVSALGIRLQGIAPEIHFDMRTNGNGSLTRIYRDIRFSADKTPYKTNIAMMFTARDAKHMGAPGFGLQLTPQQVELVAGIFSFDKAQLARYRAAVLDSALGTELVEAAQQVSSAGTYTLGGKALKKAPRGYDTDALRAEWLLYKGLHVYSPVISLDVAQSPALVDAAMAHFEKMAPIYRWLRNMLEGASSS